ncbi:hypothetical protein J4E91_011269 [Alternaria rosae]|nr:hypothetical protein J4E91_011269 [Alternaria rosae]
MEVLATFGFCFGSLGFILSTIPAVSQAADDFRDCISQFIVYRAQFDECEELYNNWETKWHAAGKGSDPAAQFKIKEMVELIESLNGRMRDEIDEDCRDATEKTIWDRFKKKVSLSKEWRMKQPLANLRLSVGHALYRKKLIDNWIKRLTDAVRLIHDASERDYIARTAGHFGERMTNSQTQELGRVEDFLETLKQSADDLYKTCTGVVDTSAWALRVHTPEQKAGLDNWKFLHDIKIELNYCMSNNSGNRESRLAAHYNKTARKIDDGERHDIECRILQVPLVDDREVTFSTASCPSKRTPIGTTDRICELLDDDEAYFKTTNWKRQRSGLIFGLVHWVLLLWKSDWLEGLCSCRIQIEKDALALGCVLRIVPQSDCDHHIHGKQRRRLRILGVILAELILGFPIDWDESGVVPHVQQWKERKWCKTSPDKIVSDILEETWSEPLAETVDFCLTHCFHLANDPWKHGYLFVSIDKIYNGVREWHGVELPSLNELIEALAARGYRSLPMEGLDSDHVWGREADDPEKGEEKVVQ